MTKKTRGLSADVHSHGQNPEQDWDRAGIFIKESIIVSRDVFLTVPYLLINTHNVSFQMRSA